MQGIGKQIKVLVKLSRDISPFFCLLNTGDSCQEHRRLWLLWLMSHNFVSATCKRMKPFNLTFKWYKKCKALYIWIFKHADLSSPRKSVIVVWVSHVTGRSWSRRTCWENWTCGTSRASWKDWCWRPAGDPRSCGKYCFSESTWMDAIKHHVLLFEFLWAE